MGTKKKESHRIIVIDKREKRDGRPIEILGSYDPKTEPATVRVDKARAEYWIGVGALPSPAVRTLLKRQGVRV
jgi:small subunit ribosomal protein S16